MEKILFNDGDVTKIVFLKFTAKPLWKKLKLLL